MDTAPSATQASEKELYASLRILTTLLEGIRPRNCQVPQHDLSDSTKAFVHLSQLLNIASPHVIAITGAADHSTSQAVLVAPNFDPFVPASHPFSTETLVATEVSEFDWDVTDVLSSTDKIRTLAQKLLKILRKLGSLNSTKRQDFLDNAKRWFLRLCWERYHFRMTTTLKKEWAVSPFEVMRRWEPQVYDLTTLRERGYDGLRLKLSAAEEVNFEDMDKEVNGQKITVYFRVEQAVLWVQLISDLLCQCHEALQEEARSSDGQPIGFDESAGLLPLLSVLLSFRPIEAIFTQTSLGVMFARFNRLPGLTEAEAGIESGLGENVLELLADEELNNAQYSMAHGGLLVFRFLETLVAPYRALVHLSKRAALFKDDIQVTLVRFPAPQDQDIQVGQGMYEKILGMLRQAIQDENPGPAREEAAYRWIENRLAIRLGALRLSRGNVHAEAGIMALVCAGLLPSSMSPEAGKPMSIGVSKKCCWTCWKLYELMQARDSDHKFDLPGSHGTIYAWSPPEFGIPVTVLRDLRRDLLKEAGKVASAASAATVVLQGHKGQASSPASVSTDEERAITEGFKVRRRRA